MIRHKYGNDLLLPVTQEARTLTTRLGGGLRSNLLTSIRSSINTLYNYKKMCTTTGNYDSKYLNVTFLFNLRILNTYSELLQTILMYLYTPSEKLEFVHSLVTLLLSLIHI